MAEKGRSARDVGFSGILSAVSIVLHAGCRVHYGFLILGGFSMTIKSVYHPGTRLRVLLAQNRVGAGCCVPRSYYGN